MAEVSKPWKRQMPEQFVFSNVWKAAGSAYSYSAMTVPAHIRKALRSIVIAQCIGLIAPLLFTNGFMLAYFLHLGMANYRILFLLALMPLLGMLLTLPLSYLADHTGKKRIGVWGVIISIAGLAVMIAAPATGPQTAFWIAAGTLVFGIGNTASGAGWFALLSPIVPEEIRGRWFGQMRMSWQITAILFSLGVAAVLKASDSVAVFQVILLTAGLLMAAKLYFYLQIPELEKQVHNPFLTALRAILAVPNYRLFNIYIFLLFFLIGAIPGLLGLLEKNTLGFSNSQLVIMGNLLATGTVAGFYLGGKSVDRIGTKPVFLTGHIVFSLCLAGVLLRSWIPLPAVYTLGILSFLFGAMQGAVGIAGTSELLAIIPAENKSLSTGLNLALISAGTSLSGIICGQLLKLNVLPDEWSLFGKTLSSHDALLAGFTGLIILMTASLQFVPTVRFIRSQWLPQNR